MGKRTPKKTTQPRRILIIRIGGMGDAIALSPVIKQVKEKTHAEITVLASRETGQIFERLPKGIIDHLIIWRIASTLQLIAKLRKLEFDYVVDTEQFARISAIFSKLPKSGCIIGYAGNAGKQELYDIAVKFDDQKHISDTFADLFREIINIDTPNEYLTLLRAASSVNAITDFLNKNIKGNQSKLVVIAPGTGNTAICRRWSADKWLSLIKHLNERQFQVVLTGADSDMDILMDITSKTDIPILFFKHSFDDFIEMTNRADLFIGNDSGPAHIAATFDKKTIVLFGCNTPLRWSPLGNNVFCFYKKALIDDPCINTHRGIVPNKCPKYADGCVNRITVEDVTKKVDEMLV